MDHEDGGERVIGARITNCGDDDIEMALDESARVHDDPIGDLAREEKRQCRAGWTMAADLSIRYRKPNKRR